MDQARFPVGEIPVNRVIKVDDKDEGYVFHQDCRIPSPESKPLNVEFI